MCLCQEEEVTHHHPHGSGQERTDTQTGHTHTHKGTQTEGDSVTAEPDTEVKCVCTKGHESSSVNTGTLLSQDMSCMMPTQTLTAGQPKNICQAVGNGLMTMQFILFPGLNPY